MSNLNTIFEQDGKVYAICSHNVPPKELSHFISTELRYGKKHIPRFQMRVVTTEDFKTRMEYGEPAETIPPRNIKNYKTKQDSLL